MKYIFIDGNKTDFIHLCKLLDDTLNVIAGGEENRKQYIQYNTLGSIHDVIIAYDNEIPVGCASYKFYETGVAEVKRVFVKDEYRGRGISKSMMILLENRGIEQGYKKFILETSNTFASAIGLYKSQGFYVIPNYGQYKEMEESICMEKILT